MKRPTPFVLSSRELSSTSVRPRARDRVVARSTRKWWYGRFPRVRRGTLARIRASARNWSIQRQVRRAAHDDLASFAGDLRSLEAAAASPIAAEAYRKALEAYTRAEHAFDRARSPDDLEPVTATIREGLDEATLARALLEGLEPPEPRPPCFFDPRHGPSTRKVEWPSDGGAPRLVTACEDDARRVEQGAEPDTRHVLVEGKPVPYWAAPPAFGPWRAGWYGHSLHRP